MRLVKLGIISIVFFALLITGFSLLLPSTINISRAIDINASVDSVYANVSDLSKWKYWYADSSEANISAAASGKGAMLNIGKASIVFTDITDSTIKANWKSAGSSMDGEFRFIAENPKSTMSTLQWNFVHTSRWYPWEKFASIVSNKTIGAFMERSLDNLKRKLESKNKTKPLFLPLRPRQISSNI